MTQQIIDIGSTANDLTGDPLRTAFNKTNANFTEVFTKLGKMYANDTADRTGVEDSTEALAELFLAAVPDGTPIELDGNYLISGSIMEYAFLDSGELHIVCKGNVTITVDPDADGFDDILYFGTTAINSCSITGGTLTINGNNKAGRGLSIRHNGAKGGTVNIETPVTVKNILETNAAATRENAGIAIHGRYESVYLRQPKAITIARTNTAAGGTKGISISSLEGAAVVDDPYVDTVTCASTAVDMDGIAIFGYASGSTNNAREGWAIVNNPTFRNCQGRSFKGQISDVVINRPRVIRTGAVVAIAQGIDFDFQFCGDAILHEPFFDYSETTGTSPFSIGGSSFSSVIFQTLLDNREMSARSIGGTMITDVALPRYCGVIHHADAKRSVIEVSGLKVIPKGSFASSAFSRAILETDMGILEDKSTKTKLIVRQVEGPFSGIRAIGYTGYSSGSVASKLSWEVTDCTSTLSATMNLPFSTLSGTAVGEVEAFLIRGNRRFRTLIAAGATFNFANLVPGCVFSVDLSTAGTITGAPSWGSSGYPIIEVLTEWFAETDKVVKVHGPTLASHQWITINGGTSWTLMV